MTLLEQIEEKVKGMKRLTDEPMPSRKDIKHELLKVSDFTKEEIDLLYWSTIYKAYSLIVRYGQKGVEDAIRAEIWFKEAKAG